MNLSRKLSAAAVIAALVLAACNRTGGIEDSPQPDNNAPQEGDGLTQPEPQGGESDSAAPRSTNFDIRGGGADAIDAAWAEVARLDAGVPFRITMTEGDLESRLTAAMAERGFGSSIGDLDIAFQDQQIGVSFNLTLTEPVSASVPATVLFDASIDSNGDLKLEAVSAEAGQASIPQEMLAAFSEALTQAMLGASTTAEADVTLTGLFIDFGEMAIRGTVKPS